jgi:hypothetical protein
MLAIYIFLLLQRDAQLWEKLLYATGGKLEISKCNFGLFLWEFDHLGRATLQKNNNQSIHITASDTKTTMTVPQLSTTLRYKYVGVQLALDSNGLVNNLDMLFPKRNRSEGRKRKVKQAIIDTQENTNNINKFAKMTLFKSGKLCAANIFCISNEDMKDRLGEVEGKMNEKKSQTAVQLQISSENQNKKFKYGATKFFQGEN